MCVSCFSFAQIARVRFAVSDKSANLNPNRRIWGTEIPSRVLESFCSRSSVATLVAIKRSLERVTILDLKVIESENPN